MTEPERITAGRPMMEPRSVVDGPFYHGGPRGLRSIRPSSETGARSYASSPVVDADVCRRDRVYVTTSRLAAIEFAAMVPNGTVYEVSPVNPRPDPDCTLEGLSFEAERATIIREIRPRGKTLKIARRAMLA